MARFSSRIVGSLEPGRIATAAARHRGKLLDLTESNPTAAGFHYPNEILDALKDPRGLRYDPNPLGLPSARDAVSGYYGHNVSPDRILLTASTSEAYSWCFKLLCEPGDEVLVPRPSYPLFEFLANLEGVRIVQYPMRHHQGWFIDADAMRSLITKRTKAIIFVHPNNPTGSYLKPSEHELIADLCARHELTFIADEVFLDYSFGDTLNTLGLYENVLTIVLSGLSKVCGLPQLKLGWMTVSGPAALRDDALTRLEWIADTFLSVGTPVQIALPALLSARCVIQDQIRARTTENLDILRKLGGRMLEPEGGWNAILLASRLRTEEEWVLHLIEEHGVLIQPGFFYDFETEAFLILSLLTRPEIFREGARRTILATI